MTIDSSKSRSPGDSPSRSDAENAKQTLPREAELPAQEIKNEGLVEKFPALSHLNNVVGGQGIEHGFVLRHPEVDVIGEREEVVARLGSHFEKSMIVALGDPLGNRVAFAEQVHGAELAVLDGLSDGLVSDPTNQARSFPGIEAAHAGVDGLLTNRPGLGLGILVADCCAVYLVDPKSPAIGLVHSGRKGTEAGIVVRAIERMRLEYGSDPGDLVLQLSPCIRPPAYECDIAETIIEQGMQAGVPRGQIHDCGVCTTSRPDLYYSYRKEKGKTGRMLALLGLSAGEGEITRGGQPA